MLSMLRAAAMLCLLAPAALAAQELPQRYRSAGVLNIAMFPAFPPLAYHDTTTNEMVGLDVELGNALGKDLGVRINWVDTNYEAAIPAMRTERIDFALSMVNVPESRDTLTFIDYIQSGAQFFTLEANKARFANPEALCGMKVGASRRGPYVRQIEQWSAAHCVPAGRPAIVAIGTEGSPDARSQMKQGRLDAMVQSAESLPYTMTQEPGTYALISTPFTDSHIAMSVPSRNPELAAAVRASFQRLMANGTYVAILTRYGLDHLAVRQGQ